ncbi:MAG TPA: hypothetical protein VEB66_01045 [Opitutaceae bacterium]|nr:hypothetical protein [Opitutaceae bacterium]
MRPLPIIVSLLLVAGILPGCATRESVRVTATAPRPEAVAARSYAVRARDPAAETGSLRYREAVGHIKTALSGRGLHETPPGVEPDLIIEVDFERGPPQAKVVPRATPQIVDMSDQPAPRAARRHDPKLDAAEIVMVYEKRLVLEARETRADASAAPAWRVVVTSTGPDPSLRRHLPVLAAATIDRLGAESEGEEKVSIDEDHPDVAFVKKGI